MKYLFVFFLIAILFSCSHNRANSKSSTNSYKLIAIQQTKGIQLDSLLGVSNYTDIVSACGSSMGRTHYKAYYMNLGLLFSWTDYYGYVNTPTMNGIVDNILIYDTSKFHDPRGPRYYDYETLNCLPITINNLKLVYRSSLKQKNINSKIWYVIKSEGIAFAFDKKLKTFINCFILEK